LTAFAVLAAVEAFTTTWMVFVSPFDKTGILAVGILI